MVTPRTTSSTAAHHQPKSLAMRLHCVILLLTFSSGICQKPSDSQLFNCRREEGVIKCEFQILDDETKEDVQVSHCLDLTQQENDKQTCIDARIQVHIVTRPGSREEDKNTQRDLHTASDQQSNSDSTSVTISGKTFSKPWSQYGPDVAASLETRPSNTFSWQYGDWLLGLAMAVRGDSQQYHQEEQFSLAVQILQSSRHVHELLEQLGHGDAKVALGNVHMTLAETYLMMESRQDNKVLEHFQISNQYFQQALQQHKIPLGITRADIELNWADTQVRVAVLSVEQIMMSTTEEEEQETEHQDWSRISHLSERGKQALQLLTEAVETFRRLVAIPTTDPDKIVQRRSRLANALQNQATVSLLLDPDAAAQSIALLEEAVQNYQVVLKHLGPNDAQHNSIFMGITETLYSLADGYLQAGNYEASKEKYRQAMAGYKEHEIPALQMTQDVLFLGADDTLEATEQALEDYNALLYGGREIQVPNDHVHPGDALYERDELYEADLHATLGALRMARNDVGLAINHFANAIQLYSNNMGDESALRALADTRLNLAMAYLRQGEFDLSVEAHADALDLYKDIVGEGKNPLEEGLQVALQQAGVGGSNADPRIEGSQAVLKHGGLTDKMVEQQSSREAQEVVKAADNAAQELPEEADALGDSKIQGLDVNTVERRKRQAEEGAKTGNDKQEPKKEDPRFQRLIDLEAYQASLRNATVKSEL